MQSQTILVVDDNPEIRSLCKRSLVGEGFPVAVARDASEALQQTLQAPPDLFIIDVGLPGMNGLELCAKLRSSPGLSRPPILFLTAKQDIADKAAGFAVGADDYLTKPFDMRELLMRVRALLRRASLPPEESVPAQVTANELRLECHKYLLSTPEKTVSLTRVEFDLMYYLMTHAGTVHSAGKLLQAVWGYPPGLGCQALVRTHIKNIRKKIEPVPSAPRHIRNVGRHGYAVDA
jgi:DNA-binding response OmpR family regulator